VYLSNDPQSPSTVMTMENKDPKKDEDKEKNLALDSED